MRDFDRTERIGFGIAFVCFFASIAIILCALSDGCCTCDTIRDPKCLFGPCWHPDGGP